jgi:hypothetical protein
MVLIAPVGASHAFGMMPLSMYNTLRTNFLTHPFNQLSVLRVQLHQLVLLC